MSASPNSGRGNGSGESSTEHCQTMIIERNLSFHRNLSKKGGTLSQSASFSSDSTPLLKRNAGSVPSILEYSATDGSGAGTSVIKEHSIRLQVIVWYIGKVDMVEGRVPMTFRVTMYWNAQDADFEEDIEEASASTRNVNQWKMLGRQKAYVQEARDTPSQTVHVPPISILNVVSFDTIGSPEVSLLREDTKLMRWTCMYRATLIQDHWRVDNFPHDDHEISLKLAVLAHRQPGSQWDRRVWKLALATEDDSMGSVRVPHGLVVDSVSIPEFIFNRKRGLEFSFEILDHGNGDANSCEKYLHCKLHVLRNSSYYDRNVMPLLGFLNFVAVTFTALEAKDFFQRGLLILNTTFVQLSQRMAADSKLPTAAYQIKMQRILNEYFFGLLILVLESLIVYELDEQGYGYTGLVDTLAALLVLSHNLYTLVTYYSDAQRVQREVLDVSGSFQKVPV